jgi:hypothetical protein
LELPVDGIFVAGNFGDRRLGCIWMGIHAICSLPRGELVREWYTLLQARYRWHDRVDTSCTMRMALHTSAIHGLDALRYDDDERGPY